MLELVEPFAGVVKPQAAFFELLGPTGVRAMQDLLVRAKQMGFVTILDRRRLEAAACTCYGIVEAETRRLMTNGAGA